MFNVVFAMSFTKKMPSFGSYKSVSKSDDEMPDVKNNIHSQNNTHEQQKYNNVVHGDVNTKLNDNTNDHDTKRQEDNNLKDIITTLQQNIQELTEKNKTLETKLIYLASEYENTKKRSAKELEDAHKFSIAKFANDAVKIFDVLITAIDNTKKEQNDQAFYDGVNMTIGEFNSLFTKLNIEKIDPQEGEMFNHNLHEAISRVPSELDVGAIVKVIRCGYSLHGRLLRPAMVVVSAGK